MAMTHAAYALLQNGPHNSVLSRGSLDVPEVQARAGIEPVLEALDFLEVSSQSVGVVYPLRFFVLGGDHDSSLWAPSWGANGLS